MAARCTTMSIPATSEFQSTLDLRSGNCAHSTLWWFATVFCVREAARTLCPARANAETTAEPIKPEEPVTNIRNAMHSSLYSDWNELIKHSTGIRLLRSTSNLKQKAHPLKVI